MDKDSLLLNIAGALRKARHSILATGRLESMAYAFRGQSICCLPVDAGSPVEMAVFVAAIRLIVKEWRAAAVLVITGTASDDAGEDRLSQQCIAVEGAIPGVSFRVVQPFTRSESGIVVFQDARLYEGGGSRFTAGLFDCNQVSAFN